MSWWQREWKHKQASQSGYSLLPWNSLWNTTITVVMLGGGLCHSGKWRLPHDSGCIAPHRVHDKVSLLFMFSPHASISLSASPQLDAAREPSQDTGTMLSDFLVSRTMRNKAHFLHYKLLCSKYFLIATENGLRDKAEGLWNHFHPDTN